MKTWTDFYTACDEHQRMGEMIAELQARETNVLRSRSEAETFIRRTAADCDSCRSLTHDAMATWARTQAMKKAPMPKYEGGWWYERAHARIKDDWRDSTKVASLKVWQKRYAEYMKAARDWASG